MIFNSEPGKIYDTIFFFFEFFNKNRIERDYVKIYNNTSFMIDCYEQVKKGIGEVPELLSPLFYSTNGSASPVSAFFSGQTDFRTESIDSFILKLTTNTDIIYQNTVDLIFSNYEKGESKKLLPTIAPGSYIDAINSLDIPLEFKFQIALLLGNFNYAISILAGLMKKVYLIVSELHNKYKPEIEQEFEQIQSEANIKLYSEALKYNVESADTTVVSITLLNQYIVYGPRKIQDMTYLMLGYKHEESIQENNDVETISIEQFTIACGNELRIKILQSIVKDGELTASQISRILDCPITTMVRHIDALNRYGIIYISKREGLQIFYKINVKLFKKVKVKIDELFKIIIEKQEIENEQ